MTIRTDDDLKAAFRRLSPDVVQRFRATGDGWQTRVDTALQDWLKTHKLSKTEPVNFIWHQGGRDIAPVEQPST